MKISVVLAALAVAVMAVGCSNCPSNNTNAMAKAAPSACNANAMAKAAPSACNANAMAKSAPLGCNVNAMGVSVCEIPQAPQYKAEEPSLCGPLPADALPGQTWCCEAIPQAPLPPQRVCVCEESVKRTLVPAEYETVIDQLEVAPARTEWKKVDCASGSGECWSLVTIPAVYETRTRQRLVREAYEKCEYVPAQYENVAAAPQAPIYRWVRHQDCEGGVRAAPVAPAAVAPAVPAPVPATK